jgi:hypothetical protein
MERWMEDYCFLPVVLLEHVEIASKLVKYSVLHYFCSYPCLTPAYLPSFGDNSIGGVGVNCSENTSQLFKITFYDHCDSFKKIHEPTSYQTYTNTMQPQGNWYDTRHHQSTMNYYVSMYQPQSNTCHSLWFQRMLVLFHT